MYRADIGASFDALEAMDEDFGDLREEYGLDNLDMGISTAKLDTSASLTVPNGSQDGGMDDSDYHPELETIDMSKVGSKGGLQATMTNLTFNRQAIKAIATGAANSDAKAIRATLESEGYDADRIRAEFKRYQDVLPPPDVLLQEQHSYAALRKIFKENKREVPRFLKYKHEGGIKPHHALCCVLLTDYVKAKEKEKTSRVDEQNKHFTSMVWILTFGTMLPQINNPAAFIRYQFSLIANAIPVEAVAPDILRRTIRDKGKPVPNYFLDPEDGKRFPPHIALLVILQDGEEESNKLNSALIHAGFCLYAWISLLLRFFLEVIGGAGAIWGGAEVFTLRTANNLPLWRGISIGVGVFCFIRFMTLNLPRVEDEGGILGPAGPWSLRLAVRLRAVCDHPFHYFVRACPKGSRSKSTDTYSEKKSRLF